MSEPTDAELARMVAERVLGGRIEETEWTAKMGGEWAIFIEDGHEYLTRLPDFPNDIAQSWRVVERMLELGWFVGYVAAPGHWANFWRIDGDKMVTAERTAATAPLAICKAALAALEHGEATG